MGYQIFCENLSKTNNNMYERIVKRVFDILISSFCLIFLSAVILVVTVCLACVNKGKPFFRQTRPGKDCNLFILWKFKTMKDLKDAEGNLLHDSLRLTRIGALLRKTSLDEIPQLFNVLKGDMSLIGPRPLLQEYLPLYNREQNRRHSVRPGITGWAQVNGRNLALFSKRFEYDVWYVDNVSFMLDLKIILLTFKKVLYFDGVKSGQDVFEVDDLRFNKRQTRL